MSMCGYATKQLIFDEVYSWDVSIFLFPPPGYLVDFLLDTAFSHSQMCLQGTIVSWFWQQ